MVWLTGQGISQNWLYVSLSQKEQLSARPGLYISLCKLGFTAENGKN